LLERTSLDASQRESLEVIKTSADALLGLLNGILDLSKIDAGRLQVDPAPVALKAELERLMGLFAPRAAEKALRFEVHLSPDVPESVLADWSLIRQVLINLVGNALKFTERGFVRCRASVAEGQLRFDVEDSGLGLSREAQARLFEPFTQADRTVHARFGGTGLGLSISRKLTRLMGGDATVRSVEGEGSTFSFWVPLVKAEAPVRPPQPVVSTRRLKVLVADDNAVNLRITTRLLELEGHEVVGATNGQDAVQAARRETFDVAVLDLQMPVLDGLAAARLLREEGLPLRLVALTANASVEDREACAAAGFDAFLTKPLAPATLLAALS